jgi:hypothetical protein
MEKKQNWDQVIEELKQKISKTRLSSCSKRQNQFFQNKMFGTDCKKSYNLLGKKNTSVESAATK